MNLLAGLSLLFVLCSLAYYVVACLVALHFRRRTLAPPAALPKVAPRVALLKPLHGLTPSLVDNVTSYLELDYPRGEYVFGVSDYGDRAAEVPLALKPRYQFANIVLSVGEEPGCANRKVAKLIRMVERVPRAEILVLSDADISVERDHLRRVVAELSADEKLGIVTCLYRARPAGGLGSRLEAMSVNTDFLPMALLSEAIEPMRHAFGATIAIKRAALETIGGFAPLKDLLADDFFLGRMAAERGYGIKLSSSLVTITAEERSFADFWTHQLRWARTYKSVRPISLATIVIHGPFWALLFLFASGLGTAGLGALAAVVAARIAMAAVIVAKVLSLPELLSEVWWVPLKDLLMTGIWFASLAGNTVMWGGRRFRLLGGGTMRKFAG